jgi:hypothetical protein
MTAYVLYLTNICLAFLDGLDDLVQTEKVSLWT